MMLKEVRATYRRYAQAPTTDPLFYRLSAAQQESRYQRNLLLGRLAEASQPFVLDDGARDLVATMKTHLQSKDDLGPLLTEAPVPFPTTWMEFEEELEAEEAPGRRYGVGVLLQKTSRKVFACGFHRPVGERFIEPSIFLTAENWGGVEISLDPHTAPFLIERMEGSEEERLQQAARVALSEVAWAFVVAVGAMHIMAASGTPLDQFGEPLFSRPERRRLEREGVLAKGAAPTITRIRLNEHGQAHLLAVDDAEGGAGGARRRAHRVRGHVMRTATREVWRKAHTRGFGPLNETVRLMSVPAEKGSPPPASPTVCEDA